MTTLGHHLDNYLKLHRQLGFKFQRPSLQLPQFVRFVEQERASYVTVELALRWAAKPGISITRRAVRLCMVRKFAKYLNAFDARNEIPPQRIFPYESPRRTPYLYRDKDVLCLINTARNIDSPKGLDGSTYSTIFGLLAVTGMRIGEALNLECKDVDLDQNVLTLRQTKGNKSRLVPLHHSTGQVLRRYARFRDRILPQLSSATFFVSEQGMRVTPNMVYCRYYPIARLLGLRGPAASGNARIHDLRHRFAISTLQKWYKSRINVDQRLPELATYLGHVHVRDTYWYLSATPELLKLATARLQRRKGGRFP